ncbi:hypothetical protein GJ496_010588 [Pomphorhynchus laevis]|nr:hypothetical protein GJ496_010588 [Pomphorhynchus laevis]
MGSICCGHEDFEELASDPSTPVSSRRSSLVSFRNVSNKRRLIPDRPNKAANYIEQQSYSIPNQTSVSTTKIWEPEINKMSSANELRANELVKVLDDVELSHMEAKSDDSWDTTNSNVGLVDRLKESIRYRNQQ